MSDRYRDALAKVPLDYPDDFSVSQTVLCYVCNGRSQDTYDDPAATMVHEPDCEWVKAVQAVKELDT